MIMKRITLAGLLAVAIAQLALAPSALAADTYGKQPVKTTTIGDVTVLLADSGAVNVAQIASSNGAAAGNGLFVLGAVYNSALPTNTSGRSVALQTDINGRLIITQDASAAKLFTNVAQVNGTTADTNTGNASAGTLRVVLASNQPTLGVTAGAPTGAGFNAAAATNIAASGSSTIVCKSGLAVSQPTKPIYWQITSAGAVRCTLQFNDNSTLTKFTNIAVAPGAMTQTYSPNYGTVGLTTSSTVTTLQYEANCTNFDSTAQDVYCSLVYCQAASGC
jgi:hypothetical protein